MSGARLQSGIDFVRGGQRECCISDKSQEAGNPNRPITGAPYTYDGAWGGGGSSNLFPPSIFRPIAALCGANCRERLSPTQVLSLEFGVCPCDVRLQVIFRCGHGDLSLISPTDLPRRSNNITQIGEKRSARAAPVVSRDNGTFLLVVDGRTWYGAVRAALVEPPIPTDRAPMECGIAGTHAAPAGDLGLSRVVVFAAPSLGGGERLVSGVIDKCAPSIVICNVRPGRIGPPPNLLNVFEKGSARRSRFAIAASLTPPRSRESEIISPPMRSVYNDCLRPPYMHIGRCHSRTPG